MFLRTTTIAAISALVLAGCAQQEEPQRPIGLEPAYDKQGGVVGCVGSDGRVIELPVTGAAPVEQRRPNPCAPPEECRDGYFDRASGQWICTPPDDDCDQGFYNSAGQWICLDDDSRDDDDDQPPGRTDPQDPTGAAGGIN